MNVKKRFGERGAETQETMRGYSRTYPAIGIDLRTPTLHLCFRITASTPLSIAKSRRCLKSLLFSASERLGSGSSLWKRNGDASACAAARCLFSLSLHVGGEKTRTRIKHVRGCKGETAKVIGRIASATIHLRLLAMEDASFFLLYCAESMSSSTKGELADPSPLGSVKVALGGPVAFTTARPAFVMPALVSREDSVPMVVSCERMTFPLQTSRNPS